MWLASRTDTNSRSGSRYPTTGGSLLLDRARGVFSVEPNKGRSRHAIAEYIVAHLGEEDPNGPGAIMPRPQEGSCVADTAASPAPL